MRVAPAIQSGRPHREDCSLHHKSLLNFNLFVILETVKSVTTVLLFASFCLVSCNKEAVNSLKEQNDQLQKQVDELIAAQGTTEEEKALVVAIQAPPEGEAFITSRSDELHPLADAEIMFFGSDFAKDFKTFRSNLIAETKDEQRSKLTRAMSDTRKELERLENSMASITEATRESENKALQEKRVGISKEILSLEEKLKESDPLVESLNKYFSSYTQLETSLVQAANVTRDKAHKLAVNLLVKVNKAIVSEGISIPKYPENHPNPKPIVTLSLVQKFDLRAPWKNKVSLYRNPTVYLSDVSTEYLYQFPGVFNNSKIAGEMRKDIRSLLDHKEQLKSIRDKLKKNFENIDEQFQVYANSTGISVDSITERLLERERIEREIPSLKKELDKWKDGSEESVKAINLAIQKAKMPLQEKIKDARKALVIGKEVLSALSGPEFQKFLSEPQKTTMQEEIKKFLDSNKLRSVRTGSDGKFSVPPKARYASSFVIRQAWGQEFFWLIKIGLEERSVILSNSNISKVGRNGAVLGALDYQFE